MTSPQPSSAIYTEGFEARVQRARPGWRRYVFAGVWLVYLGQTLAAVGQHSTGWGAIVGYGAVALFAVCYIVGLRGIWGGPRQHFWSAYAIMWVLTGAEAVFAHQDAFIMGVYLAVFTMGGLGRYAWPTIAAMTAVGTFLPSQIPSWHTGIYTTTLFTIPLVALAMWGFFGVVRSNMALAAARAELARLAAENERNRIARDLHDLLGHSLTAITVKAELARRLVERGDVDRATVEIGEVERLSRSTLADVRAAVAGHRDVTLSGELASAREVLRAAGISAELPASADDADPALADLFAWVVREGVTNVVRHSRATHCWVSMGRTWVEIVDDGRGSLMGLGSGSGLSGLRERVEAQGGALKSIGSAGGWRLRVEAPPSACPRPIQTPIIET